MEIGIKYDSDGLWVKILKNKIEVHAIKVYKNKITVDGVPIRPKSKDDLNKLQYDFMNEKTFEIEINDRKYDWDKFCKEFGIKIK